jgi:hypothetical protein
VKAIGVSRIRSIAFFIESIPCWRRLASAPEDEAEVLMTPAFEAIVLGIAIVALVLTDRFLTIIVQRHGMTILEAKAGILAWALRKN